MTLDDILNKCEKLNVFERRKDAEDYKELVFLKKDLSRWQKILDEALGPMAKPSGKEPNAEHLKMTLNYGGVYRHQTLYKKQENGSTIIAMFWPWEDKVHITLKMAIFK